MRKWKDKIKNGAFRLRHNTVSMRHPGAGKDPLAALEAAAAATQKDKEQAGMGVSAIMAKATAIRQAVAGDSSSSDEDWSD